MTKEELLLNLEYWADCLENPPITHLMRVLDIRLSPRTRPYYAIKKSVI